MRATTRKRMISESMTAIRCFSAYRHITYCPDSTIDAGAGKAFTLHLHRGRWYIACATQWFGERDYILRITREVGETLYKLVVRQQYEIPREERDSIDIQIREYMCELDTDYNLPSGYAYVWRSAANQ